MKWNDRTYDIMKWIVWVFLPALTTLVGGLGELYQWTDANIYTTLLALITVFLGSVTGLSNKQYHDDHDNGRIE